MARGAMFGWLAASFVLLCAARESRGQDSAHTPIGLRERIEVGVQATVLRLGDFDQTDYGVGGRLAFDLTDVLALEGQLTLFPRQLGSPTPFSARRVEGLVGVKASTPGEALRGLRLFGTAEAGFLRFAPSPEPLACILIYPPPLTCTLAAGQTESAIALGGGVTVPLGARVRGHADLSDLIIHFNDPALRNGQAVTAFTTHQLRLGAGVGLRF